MMRKIVCITVRKFCQRKKIFSDQNALRKYVIQLERQTLYGYAWNKFYNLEYMRKLGLQFEVVTLIEDIHF